MNDEATLLKRTLIQIQEHIESSLQEGWVDLRLRLLQLLDELERNPDHYPLIRAQLLLLLQDYPELFTVAKAWLATSLGLDRQPAIRGADEIKQIEAPLEKGSLEDLLVVQPEEPVVRYTDIEVPSQVLVDKRFSVIVNLTVTASADSADAQPVAAPIGAQIYCMITPGPGLAVLSKRMQPLTVAAEDSRPVVFYLRATTVGSHSLQIDFLYDGQIVASSTQQIAAVGAVMPVQTVQHMGPPIPKLQKGAPYPDLVIRISTLDNQLHYDLHFGDLTELSFQGPPLRSAPEQFRYDLLQEIEALGNDEGFADNDVLRELTKIGQRLYRELWPLELRREYRRFRTNVRTIQLVSDEPWIPWELLKPYDDEVPDNLIDDDFLALQFEFARWFTPGLPPAATIFVESLACIAPTDSGLPAAQRELDFLQQLAATHDLQDNTPASADKVTVEHLLGDQAQPIQLWHFACHGDFDANTPGQSPLLMQGYAQSAAPAERSGDRPVHFLGAVNESKSRIALRRYQLRPDDLVGPVATRLKQDRPFFFLNACRVGSGGMGLTGVGGWAKVLVQDCGVGALLAPMWTINDAYAHEFAELFYTLLDEPEITVAAATRKARLTLRDRHPNDPLWLAYSLYAHPNAQVVFAR